METTPTIHPLGERPMGFPAPCGKVFVEPSEEAMTPFGGFVPLAAFLEHSGIIDKLAASCPLKRTSPNASAPRDVIVSLALTAFCDGSRFVHVQRLRHDPALPGLFGMGKVVSDDTIRRFLGSVPRERQAQWVEAAARPIWKALPRGFVLDWDSTVVTRLGKQEEAEVGYNPAKRGRPSHHPLLAVVADTRLCLHYRMRPGKSPSAGDWEKAMGECRSMTGALPWLNRGDVGFSSDKIVGWHEASPERPKCLFKLRMTKGVQRAIAAVGEESWQGPSKFGVMQAAEIELRLAGRSASRRVVVTRILQGSQEAGIDAEFWRRDRYAFDAYVTTLDVDEANCWQVVDLYRRRADCENLFDELKNQWGFAGFCSRKAAVTELAARLLVLFYNLWNLYSRLLEPSRHVEAANGRRWYLFVAARLASSGRQRHWRIAVSEQWWGELKSAYERVLRWIESTAPQLERLPEMTVENAIPS